MLVALYRPILSVLDEMLLEALNPLEPAGLSHDSKIGPPPQFGQRRRSARQRRIAARFQEVGIRGL